MNKVYINVNSLNVSYIEFETIVWNVTKLDDVKLRKYITNEFEPGDKVILQLINFLSDYMDPIFVLDRWVSPIYDKKKTYDTAVFWLKVFLDENVTCLFPDVTSDLEFVENLRKISPLTYARLLKTVQNF